MERNGFHSYESNEDVLIYNFNGSPFLATEIGELILTENYETIVVKEPEGFRLYDDPGFIKGAEIVKGKVMEWNSRNRILTLGDISNFDPDQLSRETGDIDHNKFDNVIVIGQKSGAIYYSIDSNTREVASDDGNVIQEEFNDIKILDIGDESPFGFI